VEPTHGENTRHHEDGQHNQLGDGEGRFALRRRLGRQSRNVFQGLRDQDEDIEVKSDHRGHYINPAPCAGEMSDVEGHDSHCDHKQRQNSDRVQGFVFEFNRECRKNGAALTP